MIPIGVALMIAFFFLGYYVGKYQSKSGKQDEIVLPLPEVVSKNLPKEDFTFYKTLTDKGNKTVSIDLKPKKSSEEDAGEKKSVEPESGKDKNPPKKGKQAEPKAEKPKTVTAKQPEPKKQTVKNEPETTRGTDPKIRYSLQIASYPEKDSAEADVKKMKQRGYAAFITSSELEGKGTWYRVRLGSFSNRAAAEKLQKELRSKEGITPIITTE